MYPLVQDGFTLGALVLGHRLDSAFVAATRAASDAESSSRREDGRHASDRRWRSASPATLAPTRATARNDRPSAAKTSSSRRCARRNAGPRAGAALDAAAALAPRERADASAAPGFPLLRRAGRLVAALGAAFVARTVLGPFTRFVALHAQRRRRRAAPGRFDAEREAAEVRTLNESFNQLMDSMAVKRRELEERTAELAAANVVLTDEISERKRVEQALRESEAQLRQSQKLEAIGTLAGGIAHDFNNLLTVISGYTQLALMRADKSSPAADDLRQVVEAAERAANLTHQLLAFSRKQVLQPTVLDLNEVVSGISPMLRRIIGEHIELGIEREARSARVRADRGQLEQVLINLAVNARDAMPAGGHLTIATSNVGRGDGRPAQPTRRGARRQRHRRRHAARRAGAHLRAVLHHQGSREGHRPRPLDGVRHREAVRRHDHRGQRAGQGTTFTIVLPAAEAMVDERRRRSSTTSDCRAAPRRFCSSRTRRRFAFWRGARSRSAATRCASRASRGGARDRGGGKSTCC